MSDAWSPEFPVDRALAARLIGEQFPQLRPHLETGSGLQQIGLGWDHHVWRCGPIAFRFPHQTESLRSGHDVADALAQLAPSLSLATPEPLLRGTPTADYPGHFVGYRWIEGEMPARLPLTSEDRGRAALPLARFLRTLHSTPRSSATEWGLVVEGNRGNMAERTTHGRQRANQLQHTAFAELSDRAAAAMVPPPAERTPAELRVVHGDLHAGQVLCDAQHTLVGVIDWDSLALGDPAFDLIMVRAFLPPPARSVFWEIYGDRSAQARAHHLALSYGLALLAQGVETGDDGVRDEAAFSLENALSE
jgi:aminoglycoside phosphotransferase (APT) family kinase protein